MFSSIPIMLIEDDCIDAISVKRVLKDLAVTNPLVHSTNCREALEYLRDPNNEKPCFILTDLNTAEMGALEFLRIIQEDDVLSQIPVIILSGSVSQEEVIGSFKLGVSGYMVKPADYKDLVETIRTIHTYWTLSKSPIGNLASSSA